MPDRNERLEKYRSMRDFTVTAEPAGGPGEGGNNAGAGGRFVVQRHRARRLHYDFRLEVEGVLASWAVPKGPSLDPKAKQLAVHVEDHPIEYFDFEGVIPKGEYGGGDVIVWDWGTWQPYKTDDPAGAIAQGELHVDLMGQKLAGRFVMIRRDRDGSGKEQWLMFHKNDEYAQPGWDPEDHPRSVKTGRTNDEVASAPTSLWRSNLPAAEANIALVPEAMPAWEPPAPSELEALDALGKEGQWRFQGRDLRLTNLDKELFPGRPGEPPVTKRELIRYHARVAPYMLPYLVDRPVNTHRFPDGAGRPGFWHKELPAHAPAWIRRWENVDADEGESRVYAVVDSPPALAWMANYGAIELHAWTSRIPDVHQPTWAFIDVDPGPQSTFEDVLVLTRLYRAALGHLGVEGMPKVTGQRGIQIWVPVKVGYRFSETRAWVEQVSKAVGNTVPQLVSWEWQKDRRSGLARLDYTQNAINKTLVSPFSARPAPGAPVSVPIRWEDLDDPDLRSDRWTIRTVLARLGEVGDPLAPLIGRQQSLPSLS